MFGCGRDAARSDRQLNIAYISILLKTAEELVVCAAVDFLQFNNNACTDIQLAGFILGIGAAPDIAAAALKLGAQLFLRYAVFIAQTAEIVAHVAVTSYFLFHNISCDLFDLLLKTVKLRR